MFPTSILLKTVFFPSKMSLNFAIWIKMQYLQSNLHQNAITPGIVRKIIQYFFSLINLYCNWNVWILECFYHYNPLREQETFIVVLHNVITFNFPVLVFSLQSFVFNPRYRSDDITFRSEYCILMQRGCIYRLQMWIKMQHNVFKISNSEENAGLLLGCLEELTVRIQD